jgi:hypothetical protein
MSQDGVAWTRWSENVPAIPGATVGGAVWNASWKSRVVYQPYVVHANGTYYDFYNAAGYNDLGAAAEQSGIAMLADTRWPGVPQSGPIDATLWRPNSHSPVLPSGAPSSFDATMASDPKVFWDAEQNVWVMIYFGDGPGVGGHACIAIAFSVDLIHWHKDATPLYEAGGHPSGIDAEHAHKISLLFDDAGVGYMYYTAVGAKGRGIALLTSKPLR